jgi:predicted O-methyltransferase YrrM
MARAFEMTKHLLGSFLSLRSARHWTKRAEQIEFNSGLGDSAWLLYGVARSLKPMVAVEIGAARGKSACYVGMALKENNGGHLYSIDPHVRTDWNDTDSVETFEVMCSNLRYLRLTDVVTIVRKRSVDAVSDIPKPIDLLVIDGDHSYEGVKADWDIFVPHISAFGVVVFHDTMWNLPPNDVRRREDMGVPNFVEELRKKGYPVLTINRDYGVSLVQVAQGGLSLEASCG